MTFYKLQVGDRVSAFYKDKDEFVNIGTVIEIYEDGINISWASALKFRLSNEQINKLFNDQHQTMYWRLIPAAIDKLESIL